MKEEIREAFLAQNRARNWVARINGVGARPWFVRNEKFGTFHENAKGTLICYTFEGAVRKAQELNERDAARDFAWARVNQALDAHGGEDSPEYREAFQEWLECI